MVITPEMVDSLWPHEEIVVRTENHTYQLQKIDGQLVIRGHETLCPTWTPIKLHLAIQRDNRFIYSPLSNTAQYVHVSVVQDIGIFPVDNAV